MRVGLAGCDMGACAILPRIIGHGRAAELLYTGRAMTARRPSAGASSTSCASRRTVLETRRRWPRNRRTVPTFANAMTKKCLHQEWSMGVDKAIEAEAQAQAICMQTQDFARAYDAFVAKQKPVFEGN